MSETSCLIFHHHCEGEVRGIHFKYKPDHYHFSVQNPPRASFSCRVKAKILTMTYKVLHDPPSLHLLCPRSPQVTPFQPHRSLRCSMDVPSTLSPLGLCSCSLCLGFSSSRPEVLNQGRIPLPRGQYLETFLAVTTGERELLASSG